MSKSHHTTNQKDNLPNEIEGKSYWMKEQQGNFSNKKNDTFNEKKRNIGLRYQMAVPVLDRDLNELEDIRRYEEQMLRKFYIGNGTPDDGFKISACDDSDNINNFKIGRGRCLVDGFEVVYEPEEEDFIQYKEQLDFDGSTPLKNLAPPDKEDIRFDTVYLDVKIIEVRSPNTPLEEKDTENFDKSLKNEGDVNVETSVRHRLVWRVRADEGSKGEYKKKYIPIKPGIDGKLAKLIFDSKEKHSLETGDKLNLGNGYSITAKQVDVNGNKVWLEFDKDGHRVDDENVSTDSDDNHTWTCELDDIQGEDDVPVLIVHVNKVFNDGRVDIAEIDWVWLIDYENAVKIEDIDESYYHHYYDLAMITRKKNISEIKDADIKDLREERGKDKKTIQSLAFKNDNVPSEEWPKLTCEAPEQLDLFNGYIHVHGGYKSVFSKQGAYLAWNKSRGNGETDFVNNMGVGPIGGFAFLNKQYEQDPTTLMCITGSGNVGIGNSIPLGRLHLLDSGEKWSYFNYGADLIIQGKDRHPSIGIFDYKGANPWAITNKENELWFSQMPDLGDVATYPIPKMKIDKYKLDFNGMSLFGGADANLDPGDNNKETQRSEDALKSLNKSGKLLIGWNRSRGDGEIDFIANRGAGTKGGFWFYDCPNVDNNEFKLNPLLKIFTDGSLETGAGFFVDAKGNLGSRSISFSHEINDSNPDIIISTTSMKIEGETVLDFVRTDDHSDEHHPVITQDMNLDERWSINLPENFSINRALYPNTHSLVHSTLGEPEIAVFYHGEAHLSNGKAVVPLPDSFEVLTKKENRTVLLTSKFEDDDKISMLAASEVKDGKFTVKMIDSNNPSQKFYWEVKAIRSDLEELKSESLKNRSRIELMR